jgi:hypothetical protein
MKFIITESQLRSLYVNESTTGSDPKFDFVDYVILQDSEKVEEGGITSWYKDGKEIMAYNKKKNTMYFKYSIWLTINRFLNIGAGHIRREFLEGWLKHHGYRNTHPWVEVCHGDLFEK